MNCIAARKKIITIALSTGLFLVTAGNVPAFMGMGSSPHGSPTNLPQTGDMKQNHGDTSKMTMAHKGNEETVVARVNGAEITMGALMHTVKDVVMMNYRGIELTKELAQRIRYESLEKLAMEELAYQRAMSLGITVDQADVAARLAAIKKAEGGEEALLASLARRKKTLDGLKNDISRFFAVKQAIEQEVDSKLATTEKEIDEAYQANKEAFVTPERVVVTDIIFFLDPEDPVSMDKIRTIRQKITDELNNDPAGLVPAGFVVLSAIDVSPESKPELYKAAKKMEVGDLSAPLVIDGTLHLLKLDAYQPRKEKDKTTARASVADQLKSFKKRQLLAEWRQGLLKNADIEIVHEVLK